MPISKRLGAEAASRRCWEAELGWEQMPERAGVADQPSHHGGPGPASQPCAEPARETESISPFSFPPASSPPRGAGSSALLRQRTPCALGTGVLGQRGARPAGSCRDAGSPSSLHAHRLILPGGTGMPDLLGPPWATLEGVSPEPSCSALSPAGHGGGLVGTRQQRLLAHALPALANPGLPRGRRRGPARQALGEFGRGSYAAVPAPRAVEGRPGRAFPFPA